MSLYSFIFVWLGIMVLGSATGAFHCKSYVNGQYVYRWRLFFAILAFLPIFFLATLGKPVSDTVSYIEIYNKIPSQRIEFLSYLKEATSGKGFIIFQYIIKKISNNNVTAFRVTLGIIHSIPVILLFRKYSENYLLSLYLFVASACHIGWMMNGLRQFMAVTIIIAATPLLLKKKFISLIIIILLAATIHTSALIMLPVIFIVNGKAWNKKTILYIILAIISMYLFGKYTNLLDSMLIGTEYEGAASAWSEYGDAGVNPIRVLVSSVPMLMGWYGKKYILKNDYIVNICVNFSVITTGLYLIAMTTSGVMLGRLPIYTSLYSFILLPALINRIFTEDSKKVVNLAMIILYFVFYIFEAGTF